MSGLFLPPPYSVDASEGPFPPYDFEEQPPPYCVDTDIGSNALPGTYPYSPPNRPTADEPQIFSTVSFRDHPSSPPPALDPTSNIFYIDGSYSCLGPAEWGTEKKVPEKNSLQSMNSHPSERYFTALILLSCVAVWTCGVFFGCMAYFLAVDARVAASNGDGAAARRKARISGALLIANTIIWIIFIAFLIFALV